MIKCAGQPACTGMTGDTETESEWVSEWQVNVWDEYAGHFDL